MCLDDRAPPRARNYAQRHRADYQCPITKPGGQCNRQRAINKGFMERLRPRLGTHFDLFSLDTTSSGECLSEPLWNESQKMSLQYRNKNTASCLLGKQLAASEISAHRVK